LLHCAPLRSVSFAVDLGRSGRLAGAKRNGAELNAAVSSTQYKLGWSIPLLLHPHSNAFAGILGRSHDDGQQLFVLRRIAPGVRRRVPAVRPDSTNYEIQSRMTRT
jgi:hypothetical protein